MAKIKFNKSRYYQDRRVIGYRRQYGKDLVEGVVVKSFRKGVSSGYILRRPNGRLIQVYGIQKVFIKGKIAKPEMIRKYRK